MATLGWIILALLLIYVAVCFDRIAARHGKNPFKIFLTGFTG